MRYIAKFITAVIGFAAEIVNANVFTGRTETILAVVVSAATALGVYAVPNSGAVVRRP